MKKLILLAFLGVIFFIGGQWWGLNLSEKNRRTTPASAQNGGALEISESAIDQNLKDSVKQPIEKIKTH